MIRTTKRGAAGIVRMAAIACVGLALGAMSLQSALAVQSERFFSTLRGDLEHRVENELASPSDKTTKRQRKAVDKSLKLLDKASDKLSTDIKVAAKCAGVLGKPFAEEFVENEVDKLADLGATFSTLTFLLTEAVEVRAGNVEQTAEALSAKDAKKIGKLLAKVEKGLSRAESRGTVYKKRLATLAGAARALEKAEKAADKALLRGKAKREQMVMTVNGESWTSRAGGVLTQFYRGDDGLDIQGIRDRADGGEDQLVILVSGVPGKGRYALSNLPNVEIRYTEKPDGAPNVQYDFVPSPTAVLLVDEADRDAGRFRVRFAFDVADQTAGTLTITNGAADMSGRSVLGAGGSLFLR